ncbi:hypothetical protein F4814DRAFT_122919 [Daldinia grandis]|nr:hypothetical protein F4814DRAFT_122919 [Daldinia grandis]
MREDMLVYPKPDDAQPSVEAFRTSMCTFWGGKGIHKPSWPPIRTHIQSSTGFVSHSQIINSVETFLFNQSGNCP